MHKRYLNIVSIPIPNSIQTPREERSPNSPLNNSTSSQLKSQGDIALKARVELLPIRLEGTTVVHGDVIAVLGLARALDLVGDFDAQLGGAGEGGEAQKEGGETHCGWLWMRVLRGYLERMRERVAVV
jgi:hypothetical protein